MQIDSDKILSMSAQEYVGHSAYIRGLYEIKGVHCEDGTLNDFMELVPKGTEVVVNYRREITNLVVGSSDFRGDNKRMFNHQYGVALIPKKK